MACGLSAVGVAFTSRRGKLDPPGFTDAFTQTFRALKPSAFTSARKIFNIFVDVIYKTLSDR